MNELSFVFPIHLNLLCLDNVRATARRNVEVCTIVQVGEQEKLQWREQCASLEGMLASNNHTVSCEPSGYSSLVNENAAMIVQRSFV